MLRWRSVYLILAISLGSSVPAASATLIEGAFSLTSFGFTPEDSVGGTTTLDVATQIDFSSTVLAGGASGDFGFVDFASVTMNGDPLIFNPFVASAPFFTISTLWSFDLDSIVIDLQSASQLNLTGLGTIKDLTTGLDDTPGNWIATFNTSGASFSFSSSTSTIPEPATLALFGIGLLGLGFLSRRRKRSVA